MATSKNFLKGEPQDIRKQGQFRAIPITPNHNNITWKHPKSAENQATLRQKARSVQN